MRPVFLTALRARPLTNLPRVPTGSVPRYNLPLPALCHAADGGNRRRLPGVREEAIPLRLYDYDGKLRGAYPGCRAQNEAQWPGGLVDGSRRRDLERMRGKTFPFGTGCRSPCSHALVAPAHARREWARASGGEFGPAIADSGRESPSDTSP